MDELAIKHLFIEARLFIDSNETDQLRELLENLNPNDRKALFSHQEDSKSLLHLLVQTNNTDALTIMLENGASPNQQWQNLPSLLYYAVAQANYPMIENLIKAGAVVNTVNRCQIGTALDLAHRNNHHEIATLLESNGGRKTAYKKTKFFKPHTSPHFAFKTKHPQKKVQRLAARTPFSCRTESKTQRFTPFS